MHNRTGRQSKILFFVFGCKRMLDLRVIAQNKTNKSEEPATQEVRLTFEPGQIRLRRSGRWESGA